MELIKPENEGLSLVEALDAEKIVVAQDNGVVTVSYLNLNKMLSIQLNAVAVQIEIHKSSIYVSTKPYAIEITEDNEESEDVHNNNLSAIRN